VDKALLIHAKRAGEACLFLCLALTVLVALAYSEGNNSFKPRLSLKVSGGWSSIPIGDMNTILTSFNNMPDFVDWREFYPNLISGEIRPLNKRILNWHLEFRLDISSRIGVAIGTSLPYQKSNEGTIDWTIPQGQRHLFTLRPKVQVAPTVLWSVYFGLLTTSRLNLQCCVGSGLYPAKISEYYRLEVFPPGFESDWGVRYWESKYCSALGLHAGIELDYRLTKALSLVLETQTRYARISDFSGTQYREGKYFGITDRESGSIYYYTRIEFYTGDRYADIKILEPPGNGIELPRDIRKAALDLSGISIRIGIKFRLF
jgi:hypothetical protein